MKKNLIKYFLLIIALLITNSLFAETPEGYIPSWKVGQRWVLEASYRDLREEGNAWLPPMQWIFKVRAQKTYNGEECYVLHIYGRKSSQKNQAILWLSVNDLRPLRVIDVFPTSSGMKYNDRDINPNSSEPLVAEGTPIPYDVPSFPLTRPEKRAQSAIFGSDKSSNTEAKKFSRIRKIGGIFFKKNVSQKSKTPDKQFSDIFANYAKYTRNAGQSFQIEISEDRSNNRLVQLWQEGCPWAISSFNRDRKVRLVPESEYMQKNGGNNK